MSSELTPRDRTDFNPDQLEKIDTSPNLPAMMEGAMNRVWCSFPVSDRKDHQAVYAARNNPCEDLDGYFDREILIRGAIAHLVNKVNDDSGEVEVFVRIVLLGADGKRYESCAAGIADSIGELRFRAGPGPWEPPLRLMPKQITTAKKRKTHKLAWILDDEPPTDKGEKHDGRGRKP